MIVAVSHRRDAHARAVLGALTRLGLEHVLLDLARLPGGARVALHQATPGGRTLRLRGGPVIDADAVTAVWWRRPRPPRVPPGLRGVRADGAVRQTLDAVMGVLASLAPRALLVNDPWRDDAAAHKTLQLAAAARAGLRLPATLVTSDRVAAEAFLAAHTGRAVQKLLRASPADWRRTVRLQGARLAAGADLPHAPIILQERIPGVDVRVTVVGDALFAAEIDARRSSSPDDYRGAERTCRIAACRVPREVERPLRVLMADLGLVFGAADFRRTDDGAWVFLEVNPSGQWDFVEERAGLPITAAVAALLARRS